MKIFSPLYWAPISYYKEGLSCEVFLMEQYHFYEKKTYQNRCEILSANGKVTLSVPVLKTTQNKTPFKDVKIAYHTDWPQQHLRAIMFAYRNSPFYEFYKDDILPLYEKRFTYLIDFNIALHRTFLAAIDEQCPMTLTEHFYQGTHYEDRRFAFHPRHKQETYLKPYTQVFAEKLSFEPDLSILDLLFNLGPETELYLKS